jgi:tripartite-type tricarboxylate transporter receptor subunit TctC
MKKLLPFILSLFFISTAFAGFPEKPITIVVHSKPGSGIDIASRLISNIAKKYTDATILVENKTGGSGTIAMRTVPGKRADGYTILAVTKSFISTMLLANTGITIDNFDWFAMMVSDPEALIINNTTDIKTLEDIIKDAEEKHGEQKWLGPLVGGLDHLFAVEVWDKLNIKANWIPYEGGSDAIAALMGKQGAVYVGNPADISGRPTLSLAAVASEKRLKNFPDVPTFREKDYDIGSEVLWRGFALKKGTPPKIKKILSELFAKIAADSAWINFVNNSSAVPVFYGEKEFTETVLQDQKKARYYLTKAGIMQADKEENDSNGLMFIISAALFIAIVIGAKKFKPEIVNGETVIALVMIFISIIIYLLTLNFEAGKLSGSVGPSSIPRLWSIILAAFSIRLIFKNFRNPQIDSDEKRNSVKTIGLIFLMATYLLIMNYLGYYISTGLFLILGMIWMNFKNYLVIALTTGGFLLMSYYIIQTLLQVPLPEGLLFY